MTASPLAGLTVVDLGQVLATPFATHLLATLGADVIKVEPLAGEWMRSGNPRGFATQNAGKRSVTVDLRNEGGAEVVLRLCEQADIFVQGFAPGTAEAMGLGFEVVRERRPGIVYASLSAFGDTGPYAGRPGFDHVVQAISGTMYSTGFDGEPPIKVGAPYLDYGTGLLLAFGILAAVMEQRRTGEAVAVDAAMLDTGLLLNAAALVNTAVTGVPPRRTGNNAFSGAIASGAFETADGWLMLAANKQAQVEKLERELGVGPFTPGDVDGTRAILEEALADRPAMYWETRLNAVGVPCAWVRSLDQVIAEGYPFDRGVLQPVDTGEAEPLFLPSAGVRIDGVMPPPAGAPPAVGEHTAAVLREFGFLEGEVDDLLQRGVVGS